MMRRTIHLICNAHLDPVWLWEWEEGAAAALSTFRVAADLCEAYDTFVFNHNEAVLYRWIEEYEPSLFVRIQRLVREGRWHIMGGWYLQPDCNMPSGESFVRQVLTGRRYFQEKFDARSTTAINFDPFGHTRGLVQILAKSGYDSYLFCRPLQQDLTLPDHDFIWVGYDGSQVMGHRTIAWYNSPLGGARQKVEQWMVEHPERDISAVLWGVGDHGGGPSRGDLAQLQALIAEVEDFEIRHSTPEAYFAELSARRETMPQHAGDINPWGVGCYTSQVRIKQQHRALENMVYATEKMASHASLAGAMPYPREELQEALRDLLFAQFHDILPGSSIQPVEDMALRLLGHGQEILSRVRARAFFALAQGQPVAVEGEIPILVYNPHPYPITTTVTCELQLADANWEDVYTQVTVTQGGSTLPTQVEKEQANIALDWRKRVIFRAELAPSQMNRFDCVLETLPCKPALSVQADAGAIRFTTEALDVVIDTQTGLVERYRVRGQDVLRPQAFLPLVLHDNEDPWGMLHHAFREVEGAFRLMTPEEAAAFAGVRLTTLAPVRVVEDGPVRTVVEALFAYGHSAICQRYLLPKQGAEMEIETRVHWNEKNRMLKLSIPTALEQAIYRGQVAYGIGELPNDGNEAVAQKWVALVSPVNDWALTCINDGIYGSDCADGELRLSLLRSPAYAGHPIGDRPVVPQDRYMPRIDQGERLYRFWINAGPWAERVAAVDREGLVRNEAPFALSFFPHGEGERPGPGIVLDDAHVQLSAFKQAEAGPGYVLRLFEPTGQPRATRLEIPALDLAADVDMQGFEVKTFVLDPAKRTLTETNLIEEPI